LGRGAAIREGLLAAFFGEVSRLEEDARRAAAEVRGRAARLGDALRRAALRVARGFGRAVRRRVPDFPEVRRDVAFRAEALRAGRDARRRSLALPELWRDFAFLRALRPAFRVRVFALRFAITEVLSAAPARCKEGAGHP
jgi:hypothetical protein